MVKGFKDKDGKFHPTEKNNKGVSSKDVSNNADDKKPSKINQNDADKIKKKKSLDDIIDVETEKRIENLTEDEYDDFLDDVGDLNQLVDDYGFSRVLKESDPTAYRVGFNDWQDSRLRDEESEINREAISQAEEELEGKEDDKDFKEKLDDLISKKEDEIRQEKEDELDEDQYDDFLDVSTGDNETLGAYSRILKEVDPTAYNVGFSDWSDGERDRIKDQVTDEIDEEESLESGEFVEAS